jgi:hypothetical protein
VEKLRKKLLLMLLLLMLGVFITSIAMIGIAKPDPATIVAIDPSPITISTPGETFTVNLTITDSPPIVQWMVRISWDPAVLNITKKPTQGPWLSQDGTLTTGFLVKPINYTGGYIPEMTCGLMEAGTTSGSGTLVILTFKALAVGDSNIAIYGSKLYDVNGLNQTYSVSYGHVTVVPEFPTPIITALFLLTTATIVILAKKVRPTIRRGHVTAP